MTNEEIIKGIKLCNGGQYCGKCPFANVKPKKNRTCCEQLMLEAGRLIAKQEEELAALRERLPAWVPVTEALPELETKVLVLDRRGNMMVRTLRCLASEKEPTFRPDGLVPQKHITRWMPLPEPPKEVESDD